MRARKVLSYSAGHLGRAAVFLTALLSMGSAWSAAIDGGAWAQSHIVNFDGSFNIGIPTPDGGFPICTPTNCGAGEPLPGEGCLGCLGVDGGFATAALGMQFGTLYGTVTASPPLPQEPTRIIQAKAFISGTWQDTFTITSATLAVGTPVELKLKLRLTGTVQHGGTTDPGVPKMAAGVGPGRDNALVATGVGPGAILPSLDLQLGRFSVEQTSTATVFTTVGASFDWIGIFEANAQGESTQTTATSTRQGATGTALFFLDVLTPGASYTTGSGHLYSSPVPLPAAWCLLAPGLAGLGWTRRRHV